MTENADAPESTPETTTCDTTTSRSQHLARADVLNEYLCRYANGNGTPLGLTVLSQLAASLRWLIEREKKRNLLPILEPVEEKPFVLTED